MDELYTRFDNIFFEKTRLSLMTIIYQEEKVSFNQLKERIGGTDGTIYTHLEKLIKAKYLTKQKEIAGTAVQTVYSITQEGRDLFTQYLKFLENMLSSAKGDEK